ncbi:MAG TPA: hypothetical protein VKA70_06065 [Blastocatellia bacterium]|nr:hypothetical protein [Blastocatellia bacterium]
MAYIYFPERKEGVAGIGTSPTPPTVIPRVLTYTTKDVIDPRISIPAQHALVRGSKNPATSADAVELLEAVKSGKLAGIYCVNWEKAAKRALKLGKTWWTVIPPDKDAILLPDPDNPSGPPMIVFRREFSPDCGPANGGKRIGETPLPLSSDLPSRLLAALLKVLADLKLQQTPLRRMRLSVWAAPQFVTEPNISGGRGIIDDVTLLRTISNDGGPITTPLLPLRMTFDRMFLQGATDNQRSNFYRDMVRMCHSQGIQILAGYGIVTEPRIGDRFNAWLENPNRSPTFDEYARMIVHFLLTLSLDPAAQVLEARSRFDGLGLDIETLGGNLGNQFTLFCRTLGLRLAQRSMLLAVAAGGLISDEEAFQGPPNPRTGLRPPPVLALGSVRATPYKIGLGLPNILIRPMAYDANLSGAGLALWHKEIIDYATNKVGLSPSQFQLGVKTVHGGLNTGITEAPHEVLARCTGLLRPNSVGLTIFALNGAENWNRWDSYDRALNPGAKAPGALGEPLQGPLNATSLARLTPALPPGARLQLSRVALRRAQIP